MHELSVTESLLEIALRHAQQAGATRVTGLHLVIGQLSSIVDDSVQFYWDFVSKDTIAEGARLHFRRIPAELACQACGERYAPDGENLACPKCGGTRVRVAAGDEFRLDSIDVEPDAPPEEKDAEERPRR
jgi:hydrogenase nickel incorporation protein HypA/HybF